MADIYQSAAYLVDRFLVWQGLEVATATATQRANALSRVIEAYRDVCRGVYRAEDGGRRHHTWSWLSLPDTTSLSFVVGVNAATDDLPSDFDGLVEDPVFAYSSTYPKSGLELEYVSPLEMERRQRDSAEAGTPEVYTIRAKTFAATDLSTFQIVIDPPTDVTLTVTIRYRQLVAVLTDSVNVFPRGMAGIGDLILQAARSREELAAGQVEGGPETKRFHMLMADFVLIDKEFIGGRDSPRSRAEIDSGLSV